MDWQSAKEEMQEILAELSKRKDAEEYVQKDVRALREDLQNDTYTVVVLGEFKRGKSTFVNALLKTRLLPMDVLPETATIHAIMYSDTPTVRVIYNDGHTEDGEPTYAYLKQFSARQQENKAAGVKQLQIGYPCEILQDRVVLVDTPGVSDLDEQRNEVTYGFLPRANAVLFLLDANSPLKKTEWEFIKNRLLPFGVTNILFLLNKYDDVDEEEEDEDLLAQVRERIQKVFEENKAPLSFEILPLSAVTALEALEQDDEELLIVSGLPAVKERLFVMLKEGNREKEKLALYGHRLRAALASVRGEVQTKIDLKRADADALQRAEKAIHDILDEQEKNREKITSYIDTAKRRVLQMVDKSMMHFREELSKDAAAQIDMYHGVGFKTFVEKLLTYRIKKTAESRVALYTPHIDTMLAHIETELARGLSKQFRQQIRIKAAVGCAMHHEAVPLAIMAEDLTSVSRKADVLTAVGSVGLLAMFGGVFMPLVGVAARPALQKHFLEKHLVAAKARVAPIVQGEIASLVSAMTDEFHTYVHKRCELIGKNTDYAYTVVLENLKKRAHDEIEKKKSAGADVEREISKLAQELHDIEGYGVRLHAVCSEKGGKNHG